MCYIEMQGGGGGGGGGGGKGGSLSSTPANYINEGAI